MPSLIDLKKEEVTYIEHVVQKSEIKWNPEAFQGYEVRKGKNCIRMTQPAIIRDGTLAFIYLTDGYSEFFDKFEKKEGLWRFKENLITVLH